MSNFGIIMSFLNAEKKGIPVLLIDTEVKSPSEAADEVIEYLQIY